MRLETERGVDTRRAVSPDGKTLAFCSDRDGQPRIWLKHLKGGGEIALTAGSDDFPRFSPDGASVLFIRTEAGKPSLHRVAVLGGDPRKIVENAEQADWSPDGKQIAFVRLRREQDQVSSSLYLIDPAGGAERELTRFEQDQVGFPRWSPDGRHVVLNTPGLISSGIQRRFFLVDVRDANVREIRPDRAGMLTAPAWISPDEIVYFQSEFVTGGNAAVSASRAYRENIQTRRRQALF